VTLAALKGAPSAPSALDCFRARSEARALLVEAGELVLHEAVDGLQAAAVAGGVVEAIGQDAAQAIMADAFGRSTAATWAAPVGPVPEPHDFEECPPATDTHGRTGWAELRALQVHIILTRLLRQRPCDTCGATPCVNPDFCQGCRDFDRRQGAPA
jgi:hypothetical protein